jgi:3-oxoacyl-[acyl-carrier-protein] synthase-3
LIPIRILGTGSLLTGRPVSTQELVRQIMPERDPARVQKWLGITTRYWVDRSTSASSMAAEALRRALQAADMPATELKRIIFVTSTGGDTISPATVHAVTDELGLSDTCDGFDLNNACTGFLSGMDLAARSVVTGLSPVAVVVAETYSRYVDPEHPRGYLVMADAAAAVIVGPGREGEGLLASHLRSSSSLRGRLRLTHPGWTREAGRVEFDAPYEEMIQNALQAISTSTQAVTQAAGVALSDVEWFLPHQPNGRMLDLIVSHMGIAPERTVPVVDEIGSVGAATVPVSLDRLYRSGRVKPGDRLLMATVGAGTGYGALLHQVAR